MNVAMYEYPAVGGDWLNSGQWTVQEKKTFYVPDVLSRDVSAADIACHAAANAHAKHLTTAARLVGESMDLLGLVIAVCDDEVERSELRPETALRLIEKRLIEAGRQMDCHAIEHTNLFLAYFDRGPRGPENKRPTRR